MRGEIQPMPDQVEHQKPGKLKNSEIWNIKFSDVQF